MPVESGMTTLKVGDVRRKGDQCRVKGLTEEYRQQMAELRKKNNEIAKEINRRPDPYFDCDWRDSKLIGHEIMASDTMHLEFRRP